jgi:hypothetical protein
MLDALQIVHHHLLLPHPQTWWWSRPTFATRLARFPPLLQYWRCCTFFTVLIHSYPSDDAL